MRLNELGPAQAIAPVPIRFGHHRRVQMEAVRAQ
jgi:hypothetical protein